jgi:hypothetical protein
MARYPGVWFDRRMSLAWRRVVLLLLAVGGLLALDGCGDDGGPASPSDPATPPPSTLVPSELFVADAAFPAALVAAPDGGLLYGERLTGRILSVDATGGRAAEPVASVAVTGTEGDQRGLLGLVSDDEGRLYASFTRAEDGRLVVAQVAPGPERLVWEGPVSADRANGGHLELHEGRLLVGVGDLLDPDAVADPATPNGKLLLLDPDAAADQVPVVLAGGWNNPFAFTHTPDGALWVADNTGGGRERLARVADDGEVVVTELGGGAEQRVPAGMVALDGERLGLCGYLSGVLEEVAVVDGRAEPTGRVLTAPCRIGVLRLSDGRVVVATETELDVASP